MGISLAVRVRFLRFSETRNALRKSLHSFGWCGIMPPTQSTPELGYSSPKPEAVALKRTVTPPIFAYNL